MIAGEDDRSCREKVKEKHQSTKDERVPLNDDPASKQAIAVVKGGGLSFGETEYGGL